VVDLVENMFLNLILAALVQTVFIKNSVAGGHIGITP